jgi:hypothetical protein
MTIYYRAFSFTAYSNPGSGPLLTYPTRIFNTHKGYSILDSMRSRVKPPALNLICGSAYPPRLLK